MDLAHRLLAIRFNRTCVPLPVIPGFITILKLLYTKEEAWLAAFMLPTFASTRTIGMVVYMMTKRFGARLTCSRSGSSRGKD